MGRCTIAHSQLQLHQIKLFKQDKPRSLQQRHQEAQTPTETEAKETVVSFCYYTGQEYRSIGMGERKCPMPG